MSRTQFEFRFTAVKQNLNRQKKMAEMNLMKCREHLRSLQKQLELQRKNFEQSAEHWGSLLDRDPAISFASHGSFRVQEGEQSETGGQIAVGMEACRQAEKLLAQAEQKLKMLEEIESVDRADFDSELRLRQANMFRDEILSNWNRTIQREPGK